MATARTKHIRCRSGLYRVVFSCVYTKAAVLLLLLAFLLQPIAPAYAEEGSADATTTSATAETTDTEVSNDGSSTDKALDDTTVEESTETDDVGEDEPDTQNTSPSDRASYDIAEDNADATETPETELNTEANVGDELATSTEQSNSTEETIPDTDTLEQDSTTTPKTQASSTDSASTSTNPGTSTPQGAVDGEATTTAPTATSTNETTPGSEDTAPQTQVPTSTSSTTESTGSSTPSSGSTTEGPTQSNETDGSAPSASSTEKYPSNTEADETDGAGAADEESDGEGDSADTSTTTSNIDPGTLPSVHYSDANRYQFSADDCVSVGDGSYYCSKADDSVGSSDKDRLFVEADGDGDKEVFIQLSGVTQQLSHNRVDDLAPYYDAVSESVVWHRLIDGRYQIVVYDLASGEESMLTDNDTNDMEPARAGAFIVWQRWVDGNWEIMLFDGESERQLTDNNRHDVAPSIRGGYVIWHSTEGNEGAVTVYEIETGLTSTIDDDDGGDIENPRFVLVYDTTYENGDVITKGYDLESGELMPLSAVPAELPDKLPEPDSTGETRALIQNKAGSKEEVLSGTDTGGSATSGPSSTASSTASSSTARSSDSVSETGTASSTGEVVDMREEDGGIELTEFDVVVTPLSEATGSARSSHLVDSSSTTPHVE